MNAAGAGLAALLLGACTLSDGNGFATVRDARVSAGLENAEADVADSIFDDIDFAPLVQNGEARIDAPSDVARRIASRIASGALEVSF